MFSLCNPSKQTVYARDMSMMYFCLLNFHNAQCTRDEQSYSWSIVLPAFSPNCENLLIVTIQSARKTFHIVHKGDEVKFSTSSLCGDTEHSVKGLMGIKGAYFHAGGNKRSP